MREEVQSLLESVCGPHEVGYSEVGDDPLPWISELEKRDTAM